MIKRRRQRLSVAYYVAPPLDAGHVDIFTGAVVSTCPTEWIPRSGFQGVEPGIMVDDCMMDSDHRNHSWRNRLGSSFFSLFPVERSCGVVLVSST
jgi:hypothetical protein